MPVCRFFLKGYCRYGSNCRFDHPGESGYNEDDKQQTSSNFSFRAALNNSSSNNNIGSFSFIQALQQGNQNSTFSADDVDMSEGLATYNSQGFSFTQAAFSFKQQQSHPLASIFSPAPSQQQIYQQQQQLYLQQQQQQNYLQQQQQLHLNTFSETNSFQQHSIVGQVPHQSQHDSNLTFQHNPIGLTQPQSSIKSSQFTEQQELSQEELKAFQSEKFEFRKIPVRPPPKVFC